MESTVFIPWICEKNNNDRIFIFHFLRTGMNYDTIKNGVQETLPVWVSVFAHPKGDL